MAPCHSQKRRALNVEDDRKAVQRLHEQIREEAQREREARARALQDAQKPKAAPVKAFDKDMLAALAAQARQMQDDEPPQIGFVPDTSPAPTREEVAPPPAAAPKAILPPKLQALAVESPVVHAPSLKTTSQDPRPSSTALGAAAAAMLIKAQAAAKEAKDAAALAAEAAKEAKVDRPLKGGPNCMGPTRGIKKKSADSGSTKTSADGGGAAASPAARLPMAVGFVMPFRPTLKKAAPVVRSASPPAGAASGANAAPPTGASAVPHKEAGHLEPPGALDDQERKTRSPKLDDRERKVDDSERGRRRERRRRSSSADSRSRRRRSVSDSRNHRHRSASRRRRSRSSGERRKRRSRSPRRR